MKLHLFKYTCGNCGVQFKAPEMSPTSYGEFLLRSEMGKEAYLNAISDPVYQEVDNLLKHLPELQNKSAVELAEILREVFGVACDPDEHGSLFSIGADPVCPSCNKRKISYWEATEPSEFVDKELPSISHNDWISLSDLEKIDLIKNALN